MTRNIAPLKHNMLLCTHIISQGSADRQESVRQAAYVSEKSEHDVTAICGRRMHVAAPYRMEGEER